ncbi:MAG: hypothetical protein M3Y89_11940 [Actinomycetota bacterium]|nr:hypothetical protein [Actinomycetota bacterium]
MDAERSELLAIYAVERQDNQTSVVVAFTIVAAALTYLTVGFSFLSSHCYAHGCDHAVRPWVQLVAPAPLVALAGYFVLNTAGTVRRSQLILDLESVLMRSLGGGHGKAPRTQHSAELVYGFKLKHRYAWAYSICTLATYGIVFGSIVAFTWAALRPGHWTWDKWSVFAIYVVILASEGIGLVIPVVNSRFATAK